MKVLITGAGGVLGNALLQYLAFRHDAVGFNHKSLDLLDNNATKYVLEHGHFNVVIHCANYDAAPRLTKNDPKLVYEKNMQMFNNLVEHKHSYERMFFLGSGAELYKNNQYAESKKEMTKIAEKINESSPKIFNLRLFGVYGWGSDWRYRVVDNLCAKAAKNLPLTLPEDKEVSLLYINDFVRLVEQLIAHKTLGYTVYELCEKKTFRYSEIANYISSVTGVKKQYDGVKISESYVGTSYGLPVSFHEFQYTPIESSILDLIQMYKLCREQIDESLFEY